MRYWVTYIGIDITGMGSGVAQLVRQFFPNVTTFSYSPKVKTRLADLARSIRGKMVISVGDHPKIREVFAGFRLKEVPFRHTVGGNGGIEVNELVYFNW